MHGLCLFCVIIRASFCRSKKVRKLHLFSTKVVFMRTFDCERLDTTYFRLRGLGQKPRFSAIPPLIEFGHCRTWLAGLSLSQMKLQKSLEQYQNILKSVMVQHKIRVPMINVENRTKYDLKNKLK